jgi:hypothetical protein
MRALVAKFLGPWLLPLLVVVAPGPGAWADGHIDRPIWSPPPLNAALSGELNDVCADSPSRSCNVAAVLRNDHAYVYPAHVAGHGVAWDAACLKAPYLDRAVVRGVPQRYQQDLRAIRSDVLVAWVAADGPLDRDDIETITFCGFALDDVLQLDWSGTDARVRFDLVQFNDADRPPLGTVASRGVFSGGLSIDRSLVAADLVLADGRFGAFVEIERSRFQGAFRAENTQIAGALRLRDNVFEAAVRLEALVVGGDTIISGNNFASVVADQPREPDGTSFSVVRLRELRLGGVLEFVDNAFDMAADGRPARSLYIQKSTIRDNDVTIHRNAFAGRVYLIELEGKKITVSQNAFAEFFELSSSNVYSFRSFANHYLGPFSVTNNRVESSLIIDSDVFDRDATRLLDVRGNQVGHDLRFAPKSWPAASYTVDFSFNAVVGPFSFYWPLMNADGRGLVGCEAPDSTGTVPPRWSGELNLVGTRVETSMRLVEGCLWDVNGMVAPLDDPPVRAAAKAPIGDPGPGYTTMVDLTLVEAGVLRLDLPADGSYAWRGKGLTFDFFGDSNQGRVARVNGGARSGQTEQTANDQLVAWLDRLERPDPEVYFAVADYLRGRGEIDRSREWLARGRAVDFGPTNCDGAVDCTRGWVTKAILFPSDFGTRPELVAVWLAVLWVTMTFIYWLHHRGWINWLVDSLRLLRRSPTEGRDDAAPTAYGPGLSDVQTAGFALAGNAPRRHVVPSAPGRLRAALREAALSHAAWTAERRRLADPSYQPEDGRTRVHGFVADKADDAKRGFSLWTYSLDVTLPVVSLGRFGVFTPTSWLVRDLTYVHHILGWWLVTLFFGASFF